MVAADTGAGTRVAAERAPPPSSTASDSTRADVSNSLIIDVSPAGLVRDIVGLARSPTRPDRRVPCGLT